EFFLRRTSSAEVVESVTPYRELFGYFLSAQKVILEPLTESEEGVMKETGGCIDWIPARGPE
ncbi:MAG TPA: hypothetical protein VLE73_05540, partial [Candidatus Saccharimonadales bacterium]|nr:hypothetical protein [Candidatus Saccharimonadales bacterium]